MGSKWGFNTLDKTCHVTSKAPQEPLLSSEHLPGAHLAQTSPHALLCLGPFSSCCLLLWPPDQLSSEFCSSVASASLAEELQSSKPFFCGTDRGEIVPHVAELTFASRLSWVLLQALRCCLIFVCDKSSRLWAWQNPAFGAGWLHDPFSSEQCHCWCVHVLVSSLEIKKKKKTKKPTNQSLHEAGNCCSLSHCSQ